MKELSTHTTGPDQIEIHAQQQHKKQTHYMGTLRVHPGQKVWELKLDDGTIREASFEKDALDISKAEDKLAPVKRRIHMKENCLYAVALNVKNAEKKFAKALGMKKKETK